MRKGRDEHRSPTAKPIRVLVVDDSAFMRKTLSRMLEHDGHCRVIGTARNGEEAIQKVLELKPDVVTLDIEMPGVNGIEALTVIMQRSPLPVIMVSSLTTNGAMETVAALELGAVDFIPKQLDGNVTNIASIQGELVAKVRAAAGSRSSLATRRARRAPDTVARTADTTTRLSSHTVSATRGQKLIAIGCSTGGPAALLEVLPSLPGDLDAGIIVVQHMPKYFTKAFADRMNEVCTIEVHEAEDQEAVRAGCALIAPGGMHLRVHRARATEIAVRLSPDADGHIHVPSVDVMMASVATVYGERAVGVILTGMGSDGRVGMRAIKESKGRTLVQDEASSIIYGMPKAVVDDGLADKVVPLSQLAAELMNMI